MRIRCLHGGIFFRPDLNYSVMSPLVMNVTCKNRIYTDALAHFAGAHAGTLTFALKHHKGSAKILIKTNMPAFLSHAMGIDMNLKYFHAMLVV